MGVTDVGVKPQVTVAFTGAIAQVSATPELNRFNEATVIVEVPLFPAMTVAETGEALKLKSLTVRE